MLEKHKEKYKREVEAEEFSIMTSSLSKDHSDKSIFVSNKVENLPLPKTENEDFLDKSSINETCNSEEPTPQSQSSKDEEKFLTDFMKNQQPHIQDDNNIFQEGMNNIEEKEIGKANEDDVVKCSQIDFSLEKRSVCEGKADRFVDENSDSILAQENVKDTMESKIDSEESSKGVSNLIKNPSVDKMLVSTGGNSAEAVIETCNSQCSPIHRVTSTNTTSHDELETVLKKSDISILAIANNSNSSSDSSCNECFASGVINEQIACSSTSFPTFVQTSDINNKTDNDLISFNNTAHTVLTVSNDDENNLVVKSGLKSFLDQEECSALNFDNLQRNDIVNEISIETFKEIPHNNSRNILEASQFLDDKDQMKKDYEFEKKEGNETDMFCEVKKSLENSFTKQLDMATNGEIISPDIIDNKNMDMAKMTDSVTTDGEVGKEVKHVGSEEITESTDDLLSATSARNIEVIKNADCVKPENSIAHSFSELNKTKPIKEVVEAITDYTVTENLANKHKKDVFDYTLHNSFCSLMQDSNMSKSKNSIFCADYLNQSSESQISANIKNDYTDKDMSVVSENINYKDTPNFQLAEKESNEVNSGNTTKISKDTLFNSSSSDYSSQDNLSNVGELRTMLESTTCSNNSRESFSKAFFKKNTEVKDFSVSKSSFHNINHLRRRNTISSECSQLKKEKRRKKEKKIIFENTPKASNADAASGTLMEAPQQTQSVYEAHGANILTNINFRAGERSPERLNEKSVFEMQRSESSHANFRFCDKPKDIDSNASVHEIQKVANIKIDARASEPLVTPIPEKSVFEVVKCHKSTANYRAIEKLVENVETKSVYELQRSKNTLADYSAYSKVSEPIQVASVYEASGTKNAGITADYRATEGFSNEIKETGKLSVNVKSVFENKPSESKAYTRWDTKVDEIAPAQTSSVFENHPVESKTYVSWKTAINFQQSKSVFETIPKPSIADASHNKALTSSSEYSSDSDEGEKSVVDVKEGVSLINTTSNEIQNIKSNMNETNPSLSEIGQSTKTEM